VEEISIGSTEFSVSIVADSETRGLVASSGGAAVIFSGLAGARGGSSLA
jgi:hypothetical protein